MLANIQIADVIDVPITVPPNTRIDIPGIGHVILFRRVPSSGAFDSFMLVTMVRLVIDEEVALLGIPAGTKIDLATARAGVGRGN